MLKRSGFKRPAMPKPPRAPLTLPPEGTQPRATMGATGFAGSVPKFDYVRSPALTKTYRRLPCQNCGADDGTVVGAHSNWAEHGKGRSIKASDIYCASLCFRCHSELDQGNFMPESERRYMWDEAHARTMAALIALSWEPGEHKLRALLQKVGICKA